MRSLRIQLVASIGLLAVASGCAGPSVKKATIGSDAEAHQLTVGFPADGFRASLQGQGVYARLKYDGTDLVASELSLQRIQPASADEEVLVYIPQLNEVLPAFASDAEYNAALGTFQCLAVKSLQKSLYHPCGSGSRLVSASGGASIARDAVALATTLGLASGVDYGVDASKILAVVKKQELFDRFNAYLSLVDAAKSATSDVQRVDSDINDHVVPHVSLNNTSGFPSPTITSSMVKVSARRMVNIAAPDRIDLTVAGDPFASARAQINTQKQQLLTSRQYDVSCELAQRVAPYNAQVSCATPLTLVNDSLRSEIVVTINSVSVGTVYPELQGHNQHLGATVSSGKLMLENFTDRYIEIQSLSVYGGREVVSLTPGWQLAPAARLHDPVPLSDLANYAVKKVFALDNVTLRTMNSAPTEFGIAVKYRTGDGGNFETLHVSKQVHLSDLVNRQLAAQSGTTG